MCYVHGHVHGHVRGHAHGHGHGHGRVHACIGTGVGVGTCAWHARCTPAAPALHARCTSLAADGMPHMPPTLSAAGPHAHAQYHMPHATYIICRWSSDGRWKVYDILFAIAMLYVGKRVKWVREAQEALDF